MKIELTNQNLIELGRCGYVSRSVGSWDGTPIYSDNHWACHLGYQENCSVNKEHIIFFCSKKDLDAFFFERINEYIESNFVIANPGGTEFFKIKREIKLEKIGENLNEN
jgi:hypothetical protein